MGHLIYIISNKRIMKAKIFTPLPMDTTDIELPEELELLVEQMSKNVHEV